MQMDGTPGAEVNVLQIRLRLRSSAGTFAADADDADLCDIAQGEVAIPPISLKQMDTKGPYTVQTALTPRLL